MKLNQYSHLPDDIRDALEGYDAMIDSGEILFDDSGYAIEYPGMEESEESLSEFLESKGADRP